MVLPPRGSNFLGGTAFFGAADAALAVALRVERDPESARVPSRLS